jgi:hypothetical protein
MTTVIPHQLPLLKPPRLDPLPVDVGHYVPVIQSQVGERAALVQAPPTLWQTVTPLVEVVGPKTVQPPLTETRVAGWTQAVRKAVGTRPIYLDVVRLKPTLAVAGKNGQDPVLARIYVEARKRGVRFVPVAYVGESSAAHVKMVATAALQDGYGVALRYRMRKVTPTAGKGHKELLASRLSDIGVDPGDSDLLVDLGFLEADSEVHPEDVADALEEMLGVADWRCVVLLGTSIPKSLSVVKQGTVGTIPRREWALWSALGNYRLTRIPAFGDYVIQHPDPPPEEIGAKKMMLMRANIRYTAETETIVARGHPISQEGSEQYEDLCKQLVARSEFAGGAYSWGDSVIDECASGWREPGSQGLWRAAGTSHHLELVTGQVRDLQQQRAVSAASPDASPG